MKWIWLTDIHLDHCQQPVIDEFYASLKAAEPTHIFITGDTGTSYNVIRYLKEIAKIAEVFFVAGNHDFLGSGIERMRKALTRASKQTSGLNYLTATGELWLDQGIAIVGHDGWYDARFGDPQPRRFLMHDWQAISEFMQKTSFYYPNFDQDVIRISQDLATEAVSHVQKQLQFTYRNAKKVIVLTHIPPWAEVAHHRGRPNDAIAAPWYTSKVMGKMLEHEASQHPEISFLVLCGHTHGRAEYSPLDNLRCLAGHSEYGKPEIQREVSFEVAPASPTE